MPRPVEAWVKAPLVPLTYGLVHLNGGTTGVAVSAALAAWLVFELGLYQARYIANDLADAQVDRQHVGADRRGRAPGDPRLFQWATAVIGVRVVVSAVVIALLPSGTRSIMIGGALALVAASCAYEAARTMIRRRPLNGRPPRLSPREVAVFGLVGAGYGVRFGLGAALAGASGPVVGAVGAVGWTSGIAIVVMFWTIEAAWLRASGDTSVLPRKSHIAWLGQLVGDDPTRLDRPFVTGGPAGLTGCLLAVASALAVLAGVSLGATPPWVDLVAILVVCSISSPLLLATWPSFWAGPAAVAMNLGSTWALAGSETRPGMVAVVVTVSGMTVILRSVSLASAGLVASPAAAARERSPR